MPVLHEKFRDLINKKITNSEFERIIENQIYDINEQDVNGETVLHLAFKQNTYDVEILFRAGADPTIRNNQKMTPIAIFLAEEKKEATNGNLRWSYALLRVFNYLQKYHPDPLSIITFLEESPFFGCYGENRDDRKKYLTDIVDVSLLPLTSLEFVLQWTQKRLDLIHQNSNIQNWTSIGWGWGFIELKLRLEGQIKLVTKAFDLPSVIDKIVNANDKNKAALFRVLLLGDPPLDAVINGLIEEGLIAQLPITLRAAFDKFCEMYEERRVILESLLAQPKELNNDEKNFIYPIYDKLNAMLYNCQEPNNDKAWRKRVEQYEGKEAAQRRLQFQYDKNKNSDSEKRQAVFKEFNSYKNQINNGNFLGKNGFLNKQKERQKIADASEKRLRIFT